MDENDFGRRYTCFAVGFDVVGGRLGREILGKEDLLGNVVRIGW